MGMRNGVHGFSDYESDINDVWIYKLFSSYRKIAREIEDHTNKRLKTPNFEINSTSKTKWGSWSPSDRIMMFSSTLLRHYEWEAVEHVMKHEMAHQIVSEIFDMDCYGVAHGSAWERACLIVGIEPNRCDSATFLSNFKGNGSSPMVEKIRKIIIHANDGGCTEEEASTFMRKAKELMLRHDIEMQDIMGTERLFVTRPFGPLMKRWNSYMWGLGTLLSENYDIKCIRTYGPNNTSRLELFGEPDKLDIAEYVGHALLNQAEILYKSHRDKVAKEKAENRLNGKYSWGKLSKRAFIEGVINGYAVKLSNDSGDASDRVAVAVAKERAETDGRSYVEGDKAIVPTYDSRLLNEMYGKAYPRLRSCSYSGSRGQGSGAGREAGSSLRLSKGVNGGGSRGKLLA